MHWFDGKNAAGTNFHNNPYIPNDTIVSVTLRHMAETAQATHAPKASAITS